MVTNIKRNTYRDVLEATVATLETIRDAELPAIFAEIEPYGVPDEVLDRIFDDIEDALAKIQEGLAS